MEAVGLKGVETYLFCSHNTIAQYIMTRLVLEQYLAAERRPGA